MSINFPSRPEVQNFEPYLPGRSLDEVKRDLRLSRVIKLASNENALGPSPKGVRALNRVRRQIHLYPDGGGMMLRRAIAKKHKVKSSEIILGAGSDEIIELLGRSFLRLEDEIVVSEHAFIRYKMAADLMGARTRVVPMRGYSHDLEGMLKAVNNRTRMVFVANPNNPTGTYNGEKEVAEFLMALPGHVLAVFDEAYFEYSRKLKRDYPDTLKFFRGGRFMAVLRTFSKVYGLAGLRIGYGFLPEDVVKVLDRVRPPFNTSSASQVCAMAAMSDTSHVKRSVKMVQRGLNDLVNELKKMEVPFVPTVANFLLVDVAPRRGNEVFEKLLRQGVIVRAMNEYGFPHHIRVTVGLPMENKFFLKGLKRVLSS